MWRVEAFLASKTMWMEKGEGGYCAKIKVTLVGMVEQKN